MSTTTYPVTGMACDHCVAAVTQEISRLSGVTAVVIDLDPGAVSTVHVTSDAPLDDAALAAAVNEAGYQMGRA